MKMCKDRFEEYIVLMIRRSEALKLKQEKPELFMRYQKTYDKIDARLKEEYKAFAAYVITDGNNDITEEYALLIGKCYEPVWQKVRQGYRQNDFEMMLRYLTVLRNVFLTVSRQR